MARKSLLFSSVLCLVLCCAVCSQAEAQAFAAAAAVAAPPDVAKGPMPLVNADPDNATILARVETLINEKSYPDAVHLLQELIEKGEGFYASPTPGLYVSLRIKAIEILGKIGPEGMALYRSTYNAQAQKLYSDSLESYDLAGFQRVADRYFHTSAGPKAMDMLGTLYFDSGKFLQAGYYWKRLAQMDPSADSAPVMKAKAALAMYLGGEAPAGDALIAELKKDSPDAKAVFGGQEQNVIDYVERLRTTAVSSVAVAPASSNDYPGWGGLPGGFGRMTDVDVVLAPRWRRPEIDPTAGPDLMKELLVSKSMLMPPNPAMYGYQGYKAIAELRNGQIRARINAPNMGQGVKDYILPGMLLPVIVDGKVVVRTSGRIEAYGLVDGELKWASEQPLFRTLSSAVARNNMAYWNPTLRMCDAGMHGVTYAGGKLYFLANFRPPVQVNQFAGPGMPAPAKDDNLVDNSKIVALWANSGKLVDGWEVGCGKGSDDVIRSGKFISAPAYANGRIYSLVMYLENGFYLVCLDASDGSLIWKQFLAQSPGINPNIGQINGNYHFGSVPAVSDGKVFAVTNLGVLAAFDAATGQPIWAYQYDSQIEAALRGQGGPAYFNLRSANPVIVTRGRVIVTPADSTKVVAVSTEDGSPIWQVDRQNRADMTGIDENRILLSGDGLNVLSTLDGQELFSNSDVSAVNGRPAVTASSILACGSGVMYKVSLADYSVGRIELNDADGLLGNLVCADGKLIAANSLGLCAYFKFEDARNELTKRIEAAGEADRPELISRRAQLAFTAGRYDLALEDYRACLSASASATQPDDPLQKMRSAAQMGLYRTYVMRGNTCGNNQQMVSDFREALAAATTPAQKAQSNLRLAKALALAGQYEQAATAAQELSEQARDVEIVDVEVGPEAKDVARFSAKDPTSPAAELAQQFIARLVGSQGRACYGKHDDLAQKEYKSALTAGDAARLETVFARWPNSAAAIDALYSAAELNYKNSIGKSPDESEELLQQALRLLHVIHNHQGSAKHLQATVAMAAIYSRQQWGRNYAAILLDSVREQGGDQAVSFGDISGKLSEVLAKIDGGQLPKLPSDIRQKRDVELPLRERFEISDPDTFILRDHDYQPLRIGESFAVLMGNRVVLLDSAAGTQDQATAGWSGLSNARGDAVRRRPAYYPQVVCGLSADAKTMAVANQDGITALDVATAKIRWQKKVADVGLSGQIMIAVGGGAVVANDMNGNIACVDITTGEHWQNVLPISKPNPQTGQPSGVVGLPQVGGGLVVVPINTLKTLMVFGLKSGKLLQKYDGPKTADAMITPEGLLVMLQDRELSIRESAKLDKPLWTRKYDSAATPILLAVSKDFIAISLQRTSGLIEVLPVTGGGKVEGTFRTASVGGAAVPLDAQFDDDRLLVTCGSGFIMPRRSNPAQPVFGRGLSVQRFDVKSGKSDPIWSQAIQGDSQSGNAVLPLAVGAKQVIVTVKSPRQDQPGNICILDMKDGKVLDKKVSLAGHGAEGKGDKSRLTSLGTPVLLDGRLGVETLEGVMIYGK